MNHLLSERDRILQEQRDALQKQLQEHQDNLNNLVKEQVEYEKNHEDMECEMESLEV